MDVIRTLIADDDPEVRALVRTIVTSVDDIAVVAEAATGAAAVAASDRHHPDVVLMDIQMPGDGLAATETIRRQHPDQAVVILTTFGEDTYIHRALQLGVSGFLLKTADPTELIGAVRAASTGGASLSPHVAARLIHYVAHRNSVTSRDTTALQRLTARERQILRGLAHGSSNAEIAAEHHLTEGTVKGYVSGIFQRLEVRNRVEAAVIAHNSGLIDNLSVTPVGHERG